MCVLHSTSMTRLSSGDEAPNFTLQSEQGEQSLSDYAGEWLVLYFYPRNFTGGCTQEACDFRDLSAKMNAAVVGVSPDSVDSHQKFKEEHNLNFLLLADEANETAKAYGAYGTKKNYGKEYEGLIRSTFIINPEGGVAEAMYNVKATGHAARVAKKLRELQAA